MAEAERPDGALILQAGRVFAADLAIAPAMTLRGGEAVDSYREPPPFDPILDKPTDAYLEAYAFNGLVYLDADSWRHYLPRLMEYSLTHPGAERGMVAEAVVWSLRPPDHEPPRLGSLTPPQEALVVALLEQLAFGEVPFPERDLALQALEEWWIPGALYREPRED